MKSTIAHFATLSIHVYENIRRAEAEAEEDEKIDTLI